MKTILVVDDEPLVRRSLSRAFAQKGWQVVEAENGAQGLALWRANPPKVALVDVLMPVMSGPQMLESLTESERHKALVILMSAYTGQEHDPSRSIADSFFAKPFDDIFAVVEKVEAMVSSKQS